MITIFYTYRPSVLTFQTLARKNEFKVKTVINTGGAVGLAERINMMIPYKEVSRFRLYI